MSVTVCVCVCVMHICKCGCLNVCLSSCGAPTEAILTQLPVCPCCVCALLYVQLCVCLCMYVPQGPSHGFHQESKNKANKIIIIQYINLNHSLGRGHSAQLC